MLKERPKAKHDPLDPAFYTYRLSFACRFGWHAWKWGELIRGDHFQRKTCTRCGRTVDRMT